MVNTGYNGGTVPTSSSFQVWHTCTIPPTLSGNSAAWFVQNSDYGAKFGDTIQLQLQVPPPTLPSIDTVDHVTLTASLPYTQGVPAAPGNPGYVPHTGNLYNYFPKTLHLLQIGRYAAAGHILESWHGYPPNLQYANIGRTYSLTVAWKAKAACQYTTTKKHPHKQCSTIHYRTDTYKRSAQADVTINGTDYYVIATPIGY